MKRTGSDGSVGVLGDLLVGLLGSLSSESLDGLGDVVDGLLWKGKDGGEMVSDEMSSARVVGVVR